MDPKISAVNWWMTPEDVAVLCPPCAERMRESRIKRVKASAVFGRDSQRILAARVAAWEKLPKGWTEESLKSFWSSITGSGKHKVTACMEKMKGKIDDPGAFCASLADHFFGTGWRGKEARDEFADAVMARNVVAKFIRD
jgi:hypothetical protein